MNVFAQKVLFLLLNLPILYIKNVLELVSYSRTIFPVNFSNIFETDEVFLKKKKR